MRYWLLASIVTFSSFAIAFALAGAVETLLLPLLVRGMPRRPPSQRASALLCLRLLPAAAGAAFALALVLPTFLYYEPLHTDEPLTKTMALIAAVGLLVVQGAIARTARAYTSTRKILRHWSGSGRRIADLAPGLPTFVIDHPFPTVAVVGWIRPRLFVAEPVFSECTREEIEAMVLHERAHIAARDNLKRLLLRGCPSLPSVSRLESSWSAAAEEAADARAAAANPQRRLDLANALIRLARLAPQPHVPAGVSAFYPGGSIEDRVRQLLEPAPAVPSTYGCLFVGAAVIALTAVFIVSAPGVHAAMEALVRLVP